MLLKPFGILKDIDKKDPYTQSYTGVVVDNNDPLKLKRVKVLIDLWDYLTTEQLPWVRQKGDASTGNSPDNSQHNIPEIGSEVRVSFPTNNPNEPEYSGIETTTANKCAVFDEDYPNTYGHKDSAGNITIHNKNTGISVFRHNSGIQVQFDKSGAFTVTNPHGAYAHCDAMGNFKFYGPTMEFNADDKITFNATNIDLFATHTIDMKADMIKQYANNNASINANSVDINAKTSVTIPGKCVIGNLEAQNGGTAIIMDIVGGQKLYTFKDGLLQGEL